MIASNYLILQFKTLSTFQIFITIALIKEKIKLKSLFLILKIYQIKQLETVMKYVKIISRPNQRIVLENLEFHKSSKKVFFL